MTMCITKEQYDDLMKSQSDTQHMLRSVNDKLDALIPQIEQNTHALFGHNGTPGLLTWRQTQNISCAAHNNDIGNIKNAIFGNPADKNDSGLRGELKAVREDIEETKQGKRKRDAIFWAALSASVTMVATQVLQFLIDAISK